MQSSAGYPAGKNEKENQIRAKEGNGTVMVILIVKGRGRMCVFIYGVSVTHTST
jgi:hypothetical protein